MKLTYGRICCHVLNGFGDLIAEVTLAATEVRNTQANLEFKQHWRWRMSLLLPYDTIIDEQYSNYNNSIITWITDSRFWTQGPTLQVSSVSASIQHARCVMTASLGVAPVHSTLHALWSDLHCFTVWLTPLLPSSITHLIALQTEKRWC